MAINAYTGLQGSGKSFEVVSSVILPAIAAGRRVVTNVDGINEAKIHDYLCAKNGKLKSEALGEVVHITNNRILEPGFFPDEEKPEIDSVVKRGDLVAIDEAWRFWPADGGKLTHEHMQFFRMHRHYTHPETGVSCDVALMIQDITGLHRSVKNVVEVSFRTTKHKILGMAKKYRVEVYEGYKQLRTNAISRFQKAYDPAIFPLYASYSSGTGTEAVVDGRMNIFKRWWVIPISAMCVVLFFGGSWQLYKFFRPESHGVVAKKSEPSKQAGSSDAPPVQTPAFSSAWRIAGTVTVGGASYVVLAGPSGRLRFEHPSGFIYSGTSMIGKVDGETVTAFSGSLLLPMVAALPPLASK